MSVAVSSNLGGKTSRVTMPVGMPAGEKVYTVGAVAEICRVCHRTVGKWIDDGTLKGYRIPSTGKRVLTARRVRESDLLAFLHRQGMPIPDGLGGELLMLAAYCGGTPLPAPWKTEPVYSAVSLGAALATRRPAAVLVGSGIGAVEGLEAGKLLAAFGVVGLALVGDDDAPARWLAAGYAAAWRCSEVSAATVAAEVLRLTGGHRR